MDRSLRLQVYRTQTELMMFLTQMLIMMLVTVIQVKGAESKDIGIGEMRQFGDDNFASTLTGMMGALREMQEKGDKMIEEVTRQEKLLSNVKTDIRAAKNELGDLKNKTSEK